MYLDAGYVVPGYGFSAKGMNVRSRVEHVLVFIEMSMCGLVFRGVGIIRAKACVAMTNLTYNIARLAQR